MSPASADKINEALKILDEAAFEKQKEIKKMIGRNYRNLRSMMEEVGEEAQEELGFVSEKLHEWQDKAKERAKEVGRQVDDQVHEKPWLYIGGAALAGLVLGALLRGRK
ncbi:MAG: hypothetical protein ACO3LE_07525 [Bdellovibrionota bacterium]